jgi:hypothetical protein
VDIGFESGQVLTEAQFIEALKRGKAYRRAQARQARESQAQEASR